MGTPTYDPSKLSAYKNVFGSTYTPPAPTVGADGKPVAATPYNDRYGQAWDSDTQGKAFEAWMDTNKYDASGGVGTVTAPTVAPSTAGVTSTNDQTVAGQIRGIIDTNSPLMQQAETRSLQKMNQRGLMNSSMAVQAGQAALYDAALPIAQQDAQSNLTLQRDKNTFDQQTTLANLDNQMKASIANADAQTKQHLVVLDGQIKTQLANIDADYKTLIQASASAGQIYNQTISEIGKILANPDMDAATKQNNVDAMFDGLENALNFVASINGVDVTDLLTFDAGAP